ncbi:uncharacterized protein FFUJ_05493 [Fusarium fujikuroi IMI 58289]|uniref:DUF7600 domain-containing protein n=1 Tax=Gibberella fujikuroi (strain CBS 195.34 / IMI 58289 / NRRL A-6831) TaxID=1279085 RepID=S0E4M4_GIBF5|nr:uncharacterized protein FFUJ_05493 [Fusarium fujikuroi IMI 58289]CCT69595.1 uncharacterized protein FFUJ_05493 [Fusarium fujikuroi IMI 58289]SCO26627.1 uncharacterized protein FFM5_14896 [Fusarium fujikuroi]
MPLRCALCGIAIPCHHQPDQQRQQVWWRKIFAVQREEDQREEDQSHFSLVPLGYYEDGSLEPHPVIPPNEGFFIHQACWSIYRDQMFLNSERRYDTEQILQALFDFIQSMPSNSDGWISYLRHQNEPAVFLATFAGYPGYWDFLKADPSIAVTHPNSHRFVDGGTYGTQASSDVFSSLSTELNYCVINFLNTVSFCNLRLASTTIANLSKPGDIPQAFWASRFTRDHEMNFFPMEHDSTETWRDLYFNLKYSLKDSSTTGHMRNRLWIWKGLDKITPYIIAILQQRPCLKDTAQLREHIASEGYELTHKIQGFEGVPGTNPSGGIRVTGSRYLNLRGGAWISVTRGSIDGRQYILGFRVQRRDGKEKLRIGLINTNKETTFFIGETDQVIALKVATTFGGIVGLAFRIKDKLSGVDWKVVGKVGALDDYVGIKILKPQNGRYVSGLLLGLDACKVVSIQLVEKLGDATAIDSSGQHVWHPAPPQPDVVTILPRTIDVAASQPTFIMNMDFGGPSGSLLPLLTRIAIFHDHINHNVRGLGFYYNDGTEREFGFREFLTDYRCRDTALEMSVSIDGPAGERIIGAAFFPDSITYEIQINTNFGRWKTLGDRDPSQTRNFLVSPHGETITGFLGHMRMAPLSATLESMGLVHLDHLESVSPKPPPTTPSYYKGLLGGTTFVLLDGVKRVGISCGRTGRSRRPDHVSGLYFEFWDGRPPAYVGQWFKEIGHLEVYRGERITGLTFWNEVQNCACHHGRNARYSGVRIEKSSAEPNAVEVHPGPQCNMHETCYVENRFERLDTFAWLTSHDRDANDVKAKPTPLAKNCLSSASHIREEVCTNSDKLFWEIEDGKGGWTSVSQIAAFFNPKKKRLCGLEFIYRDHQVKRGGYTEGTKVILEVKSHEKVTGASSSVSTTTVDGGVDLVSFMLGDNRRMMMDFSGVKVDDSNFYQVLRLQIAASVTREVPDGASKCVGVYLEMWPDVKHKVCVQKFGSVYVEPADE